jgi:PhoPQ-activated pathogenicity-related protein
LVFTLQRIGGYPYKPGMLKHEHQHTLKRELQLVKKNCLTGTEDAFLQTVKPLIRLVLTAVLACPLTFCRAAEPAPASAPTALDRYIAATDSHYEFHELLSAKISGGTVHLLEMTSQAWLTTNEVDHPVWKHWLAVVCPDELTNRTGLLFIAGGSRRQGAPTNAAEALNRINGELPRIAIDTRSVVAELHDVPNQPLVFTGEGQPRAEDDIIAYSWDKFLRTGDERWPARLPMTKSAVRAMDTIGSFCATNSGAKVDRFVVAGASKRGWTTWSTAAVDPRVVAIVPIVFDALNLEASMRHHFAAYGFWAPAIHSYSEMRIMEWMSTPEFAALAKIEDPYEYRARFTLPKLILNDTGDQFFLPDSSQYYFDALPGEKLLRYVPNTDHSMRGSDAFATLEAFYRSVLGGTPRPRFGWSLEKDGAIKVTVTDPPKEVKLWQATNPDARDFRLDKLGPKWTSTPLVLHDGTCVARVAEPAKGWTAFMVELTYEGSGGKPFKLTTGVRVVPDKTDFKFVPQAPAGLAR